MEYTHSSLSRALYTKLVAIVEETPLRTIVKFVGLSFLTGLLSSLMTAPDATETALYAAMHWRHGILTAIACSIGIVFFAPKLARMVYGQIIELIEFFADQSVESDDTIEGIPVTEMVDHLFVEKSFKRDDVETAFGIPRNRYQRLAEKMEELDILIRGENNSRVLNPEMTRAEVIEHLKGKRVAMDLNTLNIIRPLPSPVSFTTRKIMQTA